MKKFSVLRYLKQFSVLIFLFALVGSLVVYFYGKSQQRYVASAVIQYTNSGAKAGYTPDEEEQEILKAVLGDEYQQK